MITSKLKQLDAVRAKLAHLEKTVETELRQELATLHEQYGFSDVKAFFKAVRASAGGGIRKAGRPKKTAVAPKIRKRAKITAAIRARVKKLVKSGKSGAQVAKAVGISLPSVQNIKKAAGLVKARASKVKRVATKRKTARRRAIKKAPVQTAPTAPQAPVATPAAGR